MEDEQKDILIRLNKHNKEIQDKLEQIKNTKNNDEIEELYEQILELDNKSEKYIVSYLSFLREINKLKKLCLNIEKYSICLSNSNYSLFAKKESRKNALEKILDFINFIKNNKFIELLRKDFGNRELKIFIVLNLLNLSKKEKNIYFRPTIIISWEDEELYLNRLYFSLLESMNTIMNYYSESNDALRRASNLKDYQNYNDKLENAKNDDAKMLCRDMMKALVLSESKFFNYISHYHIFVSINKPNNNFGLKMKFIFIMIILDNFIKLKKSQKKELLDFSKIYI